MSRRTTEARQNGTAVPVIPAPTSAVAPEPGRRFGLGTLACAAVYLLVTVFGTVAHDDLTGSTAPFSDQAVYYGVFCLLLGVPVHVWIKIRRGAA